MKIYDIIFLRLLDYVCALKKWEAKFMSTLVEKLKVKPAIKSKFNDEFQHYLKKQCLKTTFNGLELETFSWYKKMLGLM